MLIVSAVGLGEGGRQLDYPRLDETLWCQAAVPLHMFLYNSEGVRNMHGRSLLKPEFGINGKETSFLNYFVEFLQYYTEIYSKNNYNFVGIRLGSSRFIGIMIQFSFGWWWVSQCTGDETYFYWHSGEKGW